jgi:hypothetical protein
MPSKKPVISVRLEDEIHNTIVAWAKSDGRSLGNYIGHILSTLVYRGEVRRESARIQPHEVPPRVTRQLDISDQIVRAVKAGPAKHK